MKMALSGLVLVVCAAVCGGEIKPMATAADPAAKPLIQMAILLDTSGSMDGLIDQARAQLWSVVNQFITASREGKKPELQVALYHYGTPSLGRDTGYIRQILPFTTDLDKVSQELFALKINGGDEYCGWVIKTATEQLKWSENNRDLKVIFIAGNEPFTQGPVDYRVSCKNAIAKGIIVNTIHCGSYEQGIAEKWQDGALLADGKYSHIDQDKKAVHIDAPQDKALAKLNEDLNNTYVTFGMHGKVAKENQIAQDANAAKVSPDAFGSRAQTKASGNYRNSHWDLVDAIKDDATILEKMKVEDMPDELKKMSAAERKTFVENKAKERAEIQKKVLELGIERSKYIAEEMKKRSTDKTEDTLDKVMAKAVREQAEKRSFEFKKE